jgi:hypothetical protein
MPAEVTRKIATLPSNAIALTKHTMDGKTMPPARRVVIEQHPEGSYIFRYADDWKFPGDTWHQSPEDALSQIEWEFGANELEWTPISEAELIRLTNQKTQSNTAAVNRDISKAN